MVHTFTINGDCLAYDNESGALLFLDQSSFTVLSAYDASTGAEPEAAFWTKLLADQVVSEIELAEIRTEIATLKDEGILFRKPQEVRLEQLYPEEPRIKSMCLHLCHDCNLRCKYCFAETGDFGTGKRSFLDVETGKKAIDFLIETSGQRRNLDIDFFGGEPLMNWPVVVALTEYCETEGPKHNKDIRLTMTTNAMLLDDEKIAYLDAHMKNVVLSLDGRPEVNDKMRPKAGGQGSYEQVMTNIKKFVDQRGTKEHYIRGTYTAHNLDFSADVLHFAAEGFKHISVEPVVTDPAMDYAIREEHLDAIYAEYESLAQAYVAAKKAGEDFHFFHFNIDLENGPCLYKKMKGCGVGTEYCAVTPDGDIYPCHQFVGEEEFLLGNVHNDPPLNVPEHLKKAFTEMILPNKSDCQNCWAKYFCSGGCAANAYHANGSLDGVYDLGCRIQRKRIAAALWVQAKIKE